MGINKVRGDGIQDATANVLKGGATGTLVGGFAWPVTTWNL